MKTRILYSRRDAAGYVNWGRIERDIHAAIDEANARLGRKDEAMIADANNIKTETTQDAEQLYNGFVCLMHTQFCGSKKQRTPTTNRLRKISQLMTRPADSEKLVYMLMREYLSNDPANDQETT